MPSARIVVALAAIAAALALAKLAWKSRLVTSMRARSHVEGANGRLARREWKEAAAELRAALALDPADVDARRALAHALVQLDGWELAFVELQTAAELRPGDATTWIALARVMASQGWLEAPEAALDRAIEADPARADARAARADLRFRLGRYHGARLDAEAALAAAGHDAGAAASARATLAWLDARDGAPPPAPPRHLRPDVQIDVGGLAGWTREAWPGRLGDARRRLEAQIHDEQWDEARRTVDAARASWPEGAFAPYLAGVLALARDDTAAAERDLREALRSAPRNRAVTGALARTWSRTKEAGWAGDRLMDLAARDPGFAWARYLAARAYVEAHDPIHAEAALRRGLALEPDSPLPYQHLADYYFGLDRAPEAVAICEQGLDRFPGAAALRIMLAQILAAASRPADAERAYETVLAARRDLDVVEYRLAALLSSRQPAAGSREREAAILRDLGDDAPSDPLLADVIAVLHFRAGDADRAREILRRVVESVPDEPRPHFHLASVYAAQRQPAPARRELEAALASGRPFPERLDALRLLRETPASVHAGAAPERR